MNEEKKKPWYEDIKERITRIDRRSRRVEKTAEKAFKRQGRLVEDVAYMRGELDEMKRHNTKMVKILLGIITLEGTIIVALLASLAS